MRRCPPPAGEPSRLESGRSSPSPFRRASTNVSPSKKPSAAPMTLFEGRCGTGAGRAAARAGEKFYARHRAAGSTPGTSRSRRVAGPAARYHRELHPPSNVGPSAWVRVAARGPRSPRLTFLLFRRRRHRATQRSKRTAPASEHRETSGRTAARVLRRTPDPATVPAIGLTSASQKPSRCRPGGLSRTPTCAVAMPPDAPTALALLQAPGQSQRAPTTQARV